MIVGHRWRLGHGLNTMAAIGPASCRCSFRLNYAIDPLLSFLYDPKTRSSVLECYDIHACWLYHLQQVRIELRCTINNQRG